MKTAFPRLFADDEEVNYFDQLKRKALLAIDGLLRGSEVEELIREIDDYIVSFHAPKNFDYDSPENEVIHHRVSYERVCTGLEKNGINTDKITAFQFYSKIDYFQEIYKPKS